MNSARWRFYVNYEKEEDWLNHMSAKGFALSNYFFGRYTFKDSEPGEYIYRIELLENHSYHPESQRYIRFMEENRIEAVASWHRWVYFRKKAQDGPFDIFSDITSRLTHYRRVAAFFLILAISNITIGTSSTFSSLFRFIETGSTDFLILLLVSCPIILSLGFGCLLMWNSLRKKIKILNLEKQLRE
ncbi:MAG: DUF2812 domain-containing protein [Peptococcaceae bacterium]|nr:DUF2812 domain-containing protein [Peptococcaceae bacterium]